MGRKRLQFSEEFVRKPRIAACFFFLSGCQVACGLCLAAVWAALGGCTYCVGRSLVLFPVVAWAVFCGCPCCILWLPVLLSVVARAVLFQPWQCVPGICERAPAALFAATGALPCCVAGLDCCALAVSQVSWPSSASLPNVLWLYRIIVNFLRTPLQVIHVELLAIRVEY